MKRLESPRDALLVVAGEPPRTHDGRNIDERHGALIGEASQMLVERPSAAYPLPSYGRNPRDWMARVPETGLSYYGMPPIKQPVWKAYVPIYFWVGGGAGIVAAVGATAQLVDRKGLATLVKHSRWLTVAGTAVSSVLLILDLGRPLRFMNMFRVVRPTSPMSVGSWVLGATGGFATAAALGTTRLAGRRVRRLADGAGIAAGLLGLPLSVYTAVLLCNTAVPVWQESRRALPLLFAGSAASAGAAWLEAVTTERRASKVVRRLGIAGKTMELAVGAAVELEQAHAGIKLSITTGQAGRLFRAGEMFTAAGLLLQLLPGRRRKTRLAAALLSAAGSLAVRFAEAQAGRLSSRAPNESFATQRRRLGAPPPAVRRAAMGREIGTREPASLSARA